MHLFALELKSNVKDGLGCGDLSYCMHKCFYQHIITQHDVKPASDGGIALAWPQLASVGSGKMLKGYKEGDIF